MRVLVFLITVLSALSSRADLSLGEIAPHFSADMPIVWQMKENQLPQGFWIYKRLPPYPFSESVISNAIILASMQEKGFPKSSTNPFYVPEEHSPDYPGTIPIIFSITPSTGTISYGQPHPGTNTADIPSDNILLQRTWTDAALLGVDPAKVAFKEMTSSFNRDENDNELTNELCGRGVFLSRKLDGIPFWSSGTEDDSIDGFWMEFGSHGKIRAFSLVWPDLKRVKFQLAATPQQILACIRAFKVITLPRRNETDYFSRIKSLAKAKKLTVTRITPFYMEGVFGQTTANGELPQDITPVVQIESLADFGNSNVTVNLLAPILASEANRLLKMSSK
jgi:hypothetical protein